GRNAAAEEAAALGQCQRAGAHAPRQAEALHPLHPGRVESVLEARDRERLVEPQAEQDALPRTDVGVERLELPRRQPAALQRAEIRRQLRRRAPALVLDCGYRPEAEPEVVAAEPVREVVLRAQIPSVRATEVGRFVPAVAGAGQARDDQLEVALHGLGLAGELVAVRVREPGARLGLQLVAGQVLRLER